MIRQCGKITSMGFLNSRSSWQARRFSAILDPVPTLVGTNPSFSLRLRTYLEKWGYLDTWRKSLEVRITDRLERPRFGFPGVHDRSPPPPKTLHWRYAPAEGEYFKIRKILSWTGIHVWLLKERIGDDSRFTFLLDSLYEHVHNQLVSSWLPEASIPSFSIKSEAELLVDEMKEFVNNLSASSKNSSPNGIESFLSTHDLCGSHATPELLFYISKQRKLLASLDVPKIIQDPSSWTWDDSLD